MSAAGRGFVHELARHPSAVLLPVQLAGRGYVALFVSRLVGLTIARQTAASAGPPASEDAPHGG